MAPREYFRDDYVSSAGSAGIRLFVITVLSVLAGFFLVLGIVGGAQ